MAHRPLPGSQLERKIDQQILAFSRTCPSMKFSHLAKALPDYTWHTLFSALGRLSQQRHIELQPHRWDYEVIFVSPAALQPDQLCDRNERTHV